MTDRPIIFSGEMVRAILEGRKTQTRRPIKGISILDHPGIKGAKIANIGKNQFWLNCQDSHPQHISKGCPFGQIGDRLWVREPWHPFFRMGNHVSIEYKSGFSFATDISEADLDKFDDKWIEEKWKPSIHMPRWASRITIEITEIRVERLQEITEEEARAEGVLPCPHPLSKDDECLDCYLDAGEYACAFLNLWNRLYAKQGLGVDANPWVWVLTFRRVEGC